MNVFFFLAVVNIGDKKDSNRPVRPQKNTAERGVEGFYVGICTRSDKWLVYLPSLNHIVVSSDVAFDGHLRSTTVTDRNIRRFSGGLPL